MSRISIYVICIFMLLLSLIAFCFWWGVLINSNYPLSIAVIASGVLTFTLCILMSEGHGVTWIAEPGHIRATIAIAIVVEYMVLVGMAAFLWTSPGELPPLAQTFITNFTSVVGIVIAFYFGSSAYLQGQENRTRRRSQAQAKPEAGVGKS